MAVNDNSGAGQGAPNDGVDSSSIADILALLHSETDAHPAAAYAVGLAKTFGAHLTVTGLTRDPARQLYLAQAQAQILVAAVDAARTSASAFASKIAKAATDRGVSATALTREIQIGQGWGRDRRIRPAFRHRGARPAGRRRGGARPGHARNRAVAVGQGGDRGAALLCRTHLVRTAGRRLGRQPQRGARPCGSHADPAPRRPNPRRHRRGGARRDARRSRHRTAYRAARHCLHTPRRASRRRASRRRFSTKRVQMGSDLLVMGAYGHSRLREIVLGGTTRDILRLADLPVLLAF